jgi:hypothetical protein
MGGVETMIKKDLYKYISSFVMGDAGVYYSGKHCRLVANSVEGDYMLWKQSILENLTEVNYHIVNDKRGNRKPLHVLTTRTHPIYTQMRDRFYTNSYRGIDPHYLKMLDEEYLAILYMDDGSCYKDKRCNATPRVSLNTKRLSYGDSLLLKKALKEKLELEFNIHRHNKFYYLSLRAKDYDKFVNMVHPYILNCFQYKLL